MSVNTVKQDGSLQRIAGGTLYADAPIGAIMPYGGATAPFGWFLCQGQAISRTDYSDLFNIIGTAFGTGDGSTTFNLPDFRGEFLRGAGTNSHTGQGNGGVVGQHQDASNILRMNTWGTDLYTYIDSRGDSGVYGNNFDSESTNPGYIRQSAAGNILTDFTSTPTVGGTVTTRPTNTSVNYIIKAKQVALPVDFKDAIDDALNTFAKPISLQSANNSTISFDKSRVVGGLVTVCADITVQSGSYLVKENAIANVPNYGTGTIGYILPCIYRNTASGAEEPGYALVNPTGNIFPYYTKSEYNEMRINASYSSKN